VREVLAAVKLEEAAERRAQTYSGGMVRRLELAQALVNAPRVLILDEPTVGLDPVARDGVWERIHEIRAATGMTVLVTTHAMQEADEHCDRIALMHRGRVRALGTPSDLKGAIGPDATLTGRENVALFARLYDVPRRERAAQVQAVLDAVDLGDVADRLAKTYSGGMVRRLELAQALVSAPRVLILDEPTVGLDPVARDGVWARIHEIRRATGMTVLVTTHAMQEADEHCDRIALMHRGRIRALGTPAELKGAIGPEATLDDVFRCHTGDTLAQKGDMRDVRAARRTAGRLG